MGYAATGLQGRPVTAHEISEDDTKRSNCFAKKNWENRGCSYRSACRNSEIPGCALNDIGEIIPKNNRENVKPRCFCHYIRIGTKVVP